MDDLKSWLALAHAPGLHAGQIKHFLADGHVPTDLLRASPRTRASAGVHDAANAALHRPDELRIAADMAWLEGGTQRHVVTWGAPDYPTMLAGIPDAPLLLYVEGDPAALS